MGRKSLSLPGALLLSIVLGAQTSAASWGPPIAATAWGSSVPTGLVALNNSTAVLAFERAGGVFLKRSTDSGATWRSRVQIAPAGCCSSIAARGSSVDVVWADGDWETGVTFFYRRSTNAGLVFGPAIAIAASPAYSEPELHGLKVARGPGGLVAVIWEEIKFGIEDDFDFYQTTIRARLSTDGGASFGPPRTVATFPGEGGSTVAIGDGVVYVAFIKESETAVRLRLKRSRDAGQSWSSGVTIATGFADEGIAVAAEGSVAYVAYSSWGTRRISLRYRRTLDKGATWSTPSVLSSVPETVSESPVLSLKSGVLRAAYQRCGWNCSVPADEKIYYRESANGTTWTAAELLFEQLYYPPAAIAYAGRPIVAFRDWREYLATNGEYVYETRAVIRRGSP